MGTKNMDRTRGRPEKGEGRYSWVGAEWNLCHTQRLVEKGFQQVENRPFLMPNAAGRRVGARDPEEPVGSVAQQRLSMMKERCPDQRGLGQQSQVSWSWGDRS